jgi:hypothetical protein
MQKEVSTYFHAVACPLTVLEGSILFAKKQKEGSRILSEFVCSVLAASFYYQG